MGPKSRVLRCFARQFIAKNVPHIQKSLSLSLPFQMVCNCSTSFTHWASSPPATSATSVKPKKVAPVERINVDQTQKKRNEPSSCDFGILLDIDGVVCRGHDLLPGVEEAFDLLVDKNGDFRVPTVFVTNGSNMLRAQKAVQLTQRIKKKISADQVIMAHSPLRMYDKYHDKHVLVVGQGPAYEIAKGVGFRRVSTIEDLRYAFPKLDCVDHKRRLQAPCAFEPYFPAIEAVVLLGEPNRWETALQLIMDILMTDGKPVSKGVRGTIPYPHIPVLACNLDVLWMAETILPRFGHGTFLLCVEALYKKLTGHSLQYQAIMGKPTEITYHYAERRLGLFAQNINLDPPKTLYAIGDNVESDILGANLYHQFLSQRKLQKQLQKEKLDKVFGDIEAERKQKKEITPVTAEQEAILSQWSRSLGYQHTAESCLSVLVETGVYSQGCEIVTKAAVTTSHLQDLSHNVVLRTPTFAEKDLLSAVKMIFEREKFKLDAETANAD